MSRARTQPVVVFRPSTRAYRRFLAGGVPLAVFAVLWAARLLSAHGTVRWWLLLGLVGLVAGAVGYAAAYLRRAAVVVESDELLLVGPLRTRRVAREQIGRAVLVDALTVAVGPSTGRLFVMRRDGRRIAALDGGFWEPQSLAELAAALAVPVTRLGAVSPAAVRARDKRAVPWTLAHPIAFSVLVVVMLVVATLVGAAVAAARSGS